MNRLYVNLQAMYCNQKNWSEHSASVYLDLSKAFDTLDHNILLHKLDWYDICRVAKEWIEDYLWKHSLVTKITTSPNKIIKSETFSITCGATQGSCLESIICACIVIVMCTTYTPGTGYLLALHI